MMASPGGQWEVHTADPVRLAGVLREGVPCLRRIPARVILEALNDVHQEWAADLSPAREEAVAALHQGTGYPASVLDASLRGLFRAMDGRALEGWLRAGGISLERLDSTGADGLRVFGPDLTLVITGGGVPGAALPSVVLALVLKSPCLAKLPSAEPALLPLYAGSLAARAPEVARGLGVAAWEGGDRDLEAALLAGADAVVVYGSNETVRRVRDRLPLHARFLAYGHRISFAAIAREALSGERAGELAARAARDVCLFDQQGCLSPQAFYVERGGQVGVEQFGELLAGELERIAAELPRRNLDPAESAAIHQYRAALEMRALGGAGVRLWSSAGGTGWTVALDPEPALGPCCLNRTVVLHPLDTLDGLPELLAPHRGLLISAGLESGPERRAALAHVLAETGVTRVTRLGRAQDPASPLFHDGLNAAALLARFVRVEG